MVDLVSTVIEGLERLGVEQGHQEVKRVVVVRDHGIEGHLFLSQGVEIHVVVVGDRLDLRQIEGRQPHGGGDQDALGGLARGHLKDPVLVDSHAVGVVPLHGLEQQIQRGDVLLVLLLHLRILQHPHDHGKVLLILWGLMKQHKDDGLEERRLGLGPEWIGLMAVLGGGGLDKVIDQPQGVLFIP